MLRRARFGREGADDPHEFQRRSVRGGRRRQDFKRPSDGSATGARARPAARAVRLFHGSALVSANGVTVRAPQDPRRCPRPLS